MFAAKLKLLGTEEDKLQRVNEILEDLKLTKCENTKIGGAVIKGVSGGERKRCSIGVELITNPSLIFLDEPTTGLDSYTATILMRILRALAKSGRTIIQTIHQPNSEIFDTFDRLILLSQGKIIYFNETDKAVNYFDSIGFSCPALTNPADFFMSIMSIESIESEKEVTKDNVKEIEEEIKGIYDKRVENFDF